METMLLGRLITRNYQRKYQVKNKSRFTQAIYAAARFVIFRIHQQHTYLDSKKIRNFISNSLKKYQRESIETEIDTFCQNINKIPMESLPGHKIKGKEVLINKNQKDFYIQQTREAESFTTEEMEKHHKDKTTQKKS